MSSETDKITAEQRFMQAFERLKVNRPKALPKDSPVSQNNVAKEAGCDPSALRKSRFPSLTREIQAYVELHKEDRTSKRQKTLKARDNRRTEKERRLDAERQRDEAQSKLLSAHHRILELTHENSALKDDLEKVKPSAKNLSL
jgi:hypothetical protein